MRILLILLLSTAFAVPSVLAQADDDEGEVAVEDDVVTDDGQAASDGDLRSDDDADEGDETDITSSPDVELRYTILQPAQTSTDVQLKATKRARMLVAFSNRGSKSFLVQRIDSNFRYAHDYNYIILNNTVRSFDQIVPGGHDATFDYSFIVHEFFGGRPFYLTVTVYYRGEDASSQFRSAVFNSTLKVEEEDTGFDAETFFMYLAFTAIAALLVVLVWQAVRSAGRRVGSKIGSSSSSSGLNGVEQGTERKDGNVDYQWISPHVIQHMKADKQRGGSKRSGASSSSGSGSDSEGTASAGSTKRNTTQRAAANRKKGGDE